ncbi:50S ribosomal protein L15 [Synergistales bacterium]|nr:50S ribosomal protein L15 [Synergistales bacterium]
MNLQDLSPVKGSKHAAKRLGQGIGSGTGKTSGKGNKGHKSRTGGGVRPGFEGGQMPLARRVPKRGFNNARFATEYQVVNLDRLDKVEGKEISLETLYDAGIVKTRALPVKILADGEVTRPLTLKVGAISEKAKQKIEAAGGKVEVI